MPQLKKLRGLLVFPAMLLAGCNTVLLNPSGDIANQQGRLIVISTVLMLIIIVPVIALTVYFAWRYRHSSKEAQEEYAPDWDHSTLLELAIWAAPLLIIIALGAVTWISTHTLDPYRALSRIDAKRPLPPNTQPMVVEVVALDWKWLFIYPEQGIALVNELAAPVDRPIQFKITSTTVMNSFFIPALAGQIYAMPGMETKLHAVINETGVFDGFSANYSGAGFSGMRFKFHGMSHNDFDSWVARTKAGGGTLDRATYMNLEKPSERVPVQRFSAVAPDLYDAILNRCVDSSKMCMKEMMAIDAKGGLGRPGAYNIATKPWRPNDNNESSTRTYVAAMCTPRD